jgi:dienelactone hydrolase
MLRFSFLLLFVAMHTSSVFATSAYDALNAPAPALPNERVENVQVDGAQLQVTIAVPDGQGPFPLAVINHGGYGEKPPKTMPRYHISYLASYFMSRGYAVALPMMRGYAGSSGELRVRGCDLLGVANEAADDIGKVIAHMRQQPYVDGARVVVAGESAGGWYSLALAARNLPAVKGVVSFYGGVRVKACSADDAVLIKSSAALGTTARVPSLWLYGDNDSLFAPATWQAMFARYTEAGAPAERANFGAFMADSHKLLGTWEGLPVWTPKLDAFLGKIGMPSTSTHPEYMPVQRPPASGYATVDDISAVPYLGDEGMRRLYRTFLSKPYPRAFAIGQKAGAVAHGGFDPLTQALRDCSARSPDCRLYAYDDRVVWTRRGPPATHFAALTDAGAVPGLDAAGRKGYGMFLGLPLPRAFVIAPDGAWSMSALGADPLASAMAQCSRRHRGCAVYAVDADVVWTRAQAALKSP